ncbi:MAG: hypothetical protein WKH64_13155 [Chloroflexia bacterium]
MVTDPEARPTHRLRDRTDAIPVGAGTLRSDDPELTTGCRMPRPLGGIHHPCASCSSAWAPRNGRLFPGQPGRALAVCTSRDLGQA